MVSAKYRFTFLEFDTPPRALLPGEATDGAAGARSRQSTAYSPIGRQTAHLTHKAWFAPRRSTRIHAIPVDILRRARRWSSQRLGFALVLVANTALAERDPAECIAAHASAQELSDSGRLSEARRKFESCATSDCPKLVQKDCKVLGRAVEEAIPTLNLTVLEHHGQALAAFSVEVDGTALPPEASHRPIAVDPGNHRIRVLVSGRQAADVVIPVRKEEKNQSAVIQLTEPDTAASKARTAGYVLAGVGAAGLLSFGIFGILGYQDQHELKEKSGQPGVGNDYGLADSMRQKYLIADVSLGIGLVSLGAATYLLLTTRDSAEHAPTGAKASLDFHGLPGGGSLIVRGEF
jgi:hypothetical protein